MRRIIYTIILVSGLQFVMQAQEVTEVRLKASGQEVNLNNLSINLDYPSGIITIPLEIAFVLKNTGEQPIAIGDSIAAVASFNELIFPIIKMISTSEIAVNATIMIPYIKYPCPIAMFKEGQKANSLCMEVSYVVYGGAGAAQTPINKEYCANFTTILNPTGIADINILEQAKIYPNPVQDKLTLENLNEPTNICLYTINGQLVKNIPSVIGNIDIEVDDLSSGVYILHLQNGNTIRTEKIIKK